MTKYNIHNILKISSELPRMFPSEFVSDFESSPDLIIKIVKMNLKKFFLEYILLMSKKSYLLAFLFWEKK